MPRYAALRWPAAASLFFLLALGMASPCANADDRLPQPKGPVVLSISGDIERTTDGTRALFDVSMLQALGLVTVRTRTPWTDGIAEFEGVLLRDVLRLVGAKREVILASALNDYVAEIPPSDAMKHDVILALKKDGEYLTVRNMGPILVLYPFDSDPALQTEEVYARSVWQLAELEVGAPAEDLQALAAAKPTEPIATEATIKALEAIAPASGGNADAAPAEAAPGEADAAASATDVEPAQSEAATPVEPAAAGAAPSEAPALASAEASEAEPTTGGAEDASMAPLDPLAFGQAAPAAGETDASLAARIVNIPNGASFERNQLGGGEDAP